jgi:hypothetical protein
MLVTDDSSSDDDDESSQDELQDLQMERPKDARVGKLLLNNCSHVSCLDDSSPSGAIISTIVSSFGFCFGIWWFMFCIDFYFKDCD